MALQLPGMYWDEEKKKYFKVTADHLATPGSQYSRQAVRQREDRAAKQQKQDQHDRWRARWTAVRRSSVACSADDRYLISREIGALNHRAVAQSSIWSQRVTSRSHFHGLMSDASQKPNVTCLGWDQVNSKLMVAVYDWGPRQISYREIKLETEVEAEACDGIPAGSSQVHRYPPTQGQYGNEYQDCRIIHLSRCHGEHVFFGMDFAAEVQNVDQPDPLSPVLDHSHANAIALNPRHRLDVRPGETKYCFDFAVAGEQSLTWIKQVEDEDAPNTYNISEAYFEVYEEPRTYFRPQSALSVDWLDEHVIVAGFRNGIVALYDTRVKHGVSRLQSPSSAIHVFPLDEHRLLVAGLRSQMHMYDLRWAPEPPEQKPLRKGERGQWIPKTLYRASQAYMSYPSYSNPYVQNLPMAVSKSLGIVAYASPARDGRMKLIDLWSARDVDVPGDIKSACQESNRMVGSLLFVDEISGGSGRGPSLFIGRENIVEEWSWT